MPLVPEIIKDHRACPAFVTGSRAYGSPREDSDCDLVIRCSESTARRLRELSDDPAHCGRLGVRFGVLNLILCETDEEYTAWFDGTQALVREFVATGPVSRDRAIEVLSAMRAAQNVRKNY